MELRCMRSIDPQIIENITETMQKRRVNLPDGTTIPVLGQGTWYMGGDIKNREEELHALRMGIELGMTLIDTAEMYGEGEAEKLVGEAIKGKRDQVFLVSKVYPQNGGLDKIKQACENSLKRLKTDRLDLYLLHWRGRVPLSEVVEGMEQLKKDGKILRWGVSNFDTDDMKELIDVPSGSNCSVNQVLYHLGSRGIEYDLLPWQRERTIPTMAYSPLAHGGKLKGKLLNHPVVIELAETKQVEPMQIILAWCIRFNDIVAIPKASSVDHVMDNAFAATIKLSSSELEKLDKAFPAPGKKMPLDIL
jgi:diketogulonate reductase-like aldo/keto reductase